MNLFQLLFLLALAAIASSLPTISNSGQGKYTCSTHLEETVVKLITLLAKAEKYDEATTELKKFPNYKTIMNNVIKTLYDGNESNVKHCLGLFGSLSCPAYANGVSTLYEEMKMHNHLSEAEILVLAQYFQSHGCQTQNYIVETLKELQPNLESTLHKWALYIRNGSYQHIYQFFDRPQGNGNLESLLSQMPKLTQLAIDGNVTNFPATLSFVRSSTYLYPRGVGLAALVQELVKMGNVFSSEMIQAAKILYDITSRTDFATLDQYFTERITNATELVPAEIKALFGKDKCVIKSAYYDEYLYADETSKSVFTWITGSRVLQGDWKLEPKQAEENAVYFKLKNTFYSSPQYVCFDDTDNNLCGNKTQEATDWQLIPELTWDRQKVFVMQNKGTQKYLSATPTYDMGLKQRVVTSGNSIQHEAHWKFICE